MKEKLELCKQLVEEYKLYETCDAQPFFIGQDKGLRKIGDSIWDLENQLLKILTAEAKENE